ncbi:MAG: hypothetical protein QOJ99_2564 [Bryobacterales bacterium]|jgi:hypothetical protein|nr:hypothetical protein [Bryobacterales bacterium]
MLATARSYSSVVATMVGQHPRCASLPELKLFAYDTIGQLEASLPVYWSDRGITHRSPGLVRAIAQFEFGDQNSASMLAARAWLRDRADWSGAQVFDVLVARLSPRLAVEKSPENVEDDAALQRLAASYPRARYLHLTRHPVTTQQSLEKHLNRTIPGFVLPGQPMFGIAAWVSAQCRILAFAATLPESRYLRVRAEDVLNDPHSQLASIASWLELETSPDAIEAMLHPERSPFARPGPIASGIVGGNDPAFLSDPVPRRVALPPSVEPPEGWVENPSLWEMTLDIATRLGYL